MVSRDRVAGPDTTTDSVSHNGGDLRIRLPEPENPLKHFFITNLFDIPQVPVPVLRETRQLGLPYLENPLKHFFVTNLLYICNRVVGPDTTTDSVSHKGDPLGIGLPYLENPLKHFFITNLLYILQSGRGSGYHDRFGVAQRRSPRNRTPLPRKPLKTFFHHEFIIFCNRVGGPDTTTDSV
jgi:hypothetical protein